MTVRSTYLKDINFDKHFQSLLEVDKEFHDGSDIDEQWHLPFADPFTSIESIDQGGSSIIVRRTPSKSKYRKVFY